MGAAQYDEKLITILFTLLFALVFSSSSAFAVQDVKEVDTKSPANTLEQVTLNYLEYDSDGNPVFDVKDIKKFSKEAGVSEEFAKEYVKSANKLLKQILDQGLSVDKNTGFITGGDSQASISSTSGEGTYQIDPLHWKTYFGSQKTEHMMDNLNRQADVFAYISFGTAFRWPSLSAILALCAIDSDYQADQISYNYRKSGYHGVIFEEIHVPLSGPPIEHWLPWK